MYAVEPDDDGLWYHQVLDANWGGLEAAEDVSINFSSSLFHKFFKPIELSFNLGSYDFSLVVLHTISTVSYRL